MTFFLILYSRAFLDITEDITEAPWKRNKMKIFFSADLEKVPLFVLLILQFNIYNAYIIYNMYFHAVKSTAHPPFIGALGHSTDCIVKQSYIFAFVQACCVLLEEKLHLQTIKHTDIRKFNVRPACLLLLLLSMSVCADCGWMNVSFQNFQKIGEV